MKKRILIIVVLLLTIGFAAIATNIILNGNVNIGANEEDFAIYFSDAYIDGIQKLSIISKDRQTITYTSEVSKLGEETILEYEVTNASREYDAKVSVECLPKEDEDILLVNEMDVDIIKARRKEVGKITATLKRESTEEKRKTFECKLVFKAEEREELDTSELEESPLDSIGRTWEFTYTGSEQEFIVPYSGEYQIELWGAGAGETYAKELPSFGGYVSGILNIKNEKILYLYIGGKGLKATNASGTTGGGYNGGGNGGYYGGSLSDYTMGGGGATDIRLVNGSWNDFNSLKSRIMVAGGGAGSKFSAGGLISYGYEAAFPPATQINGNAFGYGCFKTNGESLGGHGSGGGYYGGFCSFAGRAGAGGSSFISGHNGCDAIKEESTEDNIIHTGQSNHYSGYVFTDTVMVDGTGYIWTDVKGAYTGMPTHDGASTMTGNSGNGYAKITLLRLN